MKKRQAKKLNKKYAKQDAMRIIGVPIRPDHGLKDGDVFNPMDVMVWPVEELSREEFEKRYPIT